MVKGLYTGWTGMIEEQRRLDVMSNNLANSNTVGYKKEGATNAAFARQLALRIRDSGDFGFARGLGDIQQGDKVGSIKYTRDGEFTVDNQGYFRTGNGDYLLDMNGATSGQISNANYVRVDPLQTYTVDELGNIWQNNQIVDTVGVVDVNNTDYLAKYGENLYDLVNGGTVQRGQNFRIEQGALETSNVNVVDEMVSMITIQRAYEAGQKVIQAEDETLEMATSQVGRIG